MKKQKGFTRLNFTKQNFGGFTIVELLIALAILIIAVAGGVVVWERRINPLMKKPTPTPATAERTYPSVSNFDFYQIHTIKQEKLDPGNYNTEGFVVKIFTCPPCPTGALCKPCMRENIVISEENKILKNYSSLTDKDLIIFVQNPKQFKIAKKYQFSIKIVKDKGMIFEPINDVELLGYQEITSKTQPPENISFGSECDKLKAQIKTLLAQANHCQKDSDCKLSGIPLGCPFGCYNLVNKNADLSVIKEATVKYQRDCPRCLYNCARPPKPEEIQCRDNKCIDIRLQLRNTK